MMLVERSCCLRVSLVHVGFLAEGLLCVGRSEGASVAQRALQSPGSAPVPLCHVMLRFTCCVCWVAIVAGLAVSLEGVVVPVSPSCLNADGLQQCIRSVPALLCLCRRHLGSPGSVAGPAVSWQ